MMSISENTMKLIQINSVCGLGSTGRIATDIHELMVERGHESIIAYGREDAINCSNIIRIGSKIDTYFHVALSRLFDLHGFGSEKASKLFISKLDNFNPDIIHLHNIHGYYINIEILFDYLKQTNKAVVWTLHDCWSFTGHCSNFDYVGCEKWRSACFSCPQKHSYPKSFLMDNSDRNFERKKKLFNNVQNMTIVTPSEWLSGLLKGSFLSRYPVKVINNGIDLEVFKPIESDFREKYNLQGKFIILGVAGNWDQRKGLNYFVDLSENIPKDEAIVLLGLSARQIKDLPKNIIGIKKTNNVKELVEIYSAADVFLNPTLEDNFPTTNLESLACGTPVITFATGGSSESIDDSCGIVVDKGCYKDLLKAISEIKSTGKYYCSSACLKKAHDNYDKKDRFSEYIDLYRDLI